MIVTKIYNKPIIQKDNKKIEKPKPKKEQPKKDK